MRPLFGYHMPRFTFADSRPDSRPDARADERPDARADARPNGLFEGYVELAQSAEAAGFDLLTVMDHFYQIPVFGPETAPMLEAYTTLGALAARTHRIRLGTLVTGVTYRNPAMLAKMVTTLDVISGGRAILGLGAAWNEMEHRGYGFDFPPIGERMDRLDEALTICRLMFSEERPSFAGRFYRIEEALNRPLPVQPGGPKILVGGGGEQRTLRLVARHADLANWFGTLDDFKHKDEVLRRHCETEGRDPATITRTVTVPLVLAERERDAAPVLERMPPEPRAQAIVATPVQAADRLQAWIDAGVGGFFLRNAALPTPERVALAGELIRLLS